MDYKIEYEVITHDEDTPVRGNLVVSGDDEADRIEEDRVINELEWNIWAWCCVEVKATWGPLKASAYLGGCSYKSEEDFKADLYYEDLKSEACEELLDLIEGVKLQADKVLS